MVIFLLQCTRDDVTAAGKVEKEEGVAAGGVPLVRQRRADVSFGGGAIKACFAVLGARRAPFCESCWSRADRRPRQPGETPETTQKDSKLADEPLANQVIIRKESKSYRMSAIQNLQTFGKYLFFIFIKPNR